MPLLKKRSREESEIPAASLADIAFLLLIFFLVTTTIDVDSGIGLVLPPAPKANQKPPPIKERNMLKILVNAEGNVLMDDKPEDMSNIEQDVEKFLTNNGKDPNLSESPKMAVVSLKTDRKTEYDVYIDVLDRVVGAYDKVRNEYSLQHFGKPYDKLTKDQQKEVQKAIPEQISEAEPNKSS